MNILFLVLGVLISSTSYELAKIPVGMALKEASCEKVFIKHTTWVEKISFGDTINIKER